MEESSSFHSGFVADSMTIAPLHPLNYLVVQKNTPSSSTQCNWRDSFLPSSKGSLPTNIEARVVNHKKTFERYLHSTYSYISFENHGELSNFKQEIRKIINVQIENFVGRLKGKHYHPVWKSNVNEKKLYPKNYWAIEIFKKKMYGKDVSLERV